MDLFKMNYNLFSKLSKPLAERMRPKDLSFFIGQDNIIKNNSVLKNMIKNNRFSSMILYGPPGSGKTSLANIISSTTDNYFVKISAVTSGTKEIKEIIELAKDNLSMYNKRTILFIDEIHRFNKMQQDYLLEFVENGDIIFIGATTENPAYEVNNALLSRVIVFELQALSFEHLKDIIDNAILNDEILKNKKINYTEDGISYLIKMSNGDARTALNYLELIIDNIESEDKVISENKIKNILDKVKVYYDKNSDKHYNFISAFIKSMRIGDPDAVVYYLASMLISGEDINFIARRMIIFASEDIGNANPNALILANSCAESVKKIGMPEARIILSQCAIYLACSEKSNSSYLAINKALKFIKENGLEEVPIFLQTSRSISKKNEEYKYPHDYENMVTGQEYLPEKIKDIKFYNPKNIGYEKNFFDKLKEE
ncbi:replication-associated recombination protein A [Parvimonas sp. D2]|uniref:replication-associated recombination protein A n=1 Tax=unclassified Parvimonas TaxID=1151464 RepID=UPI002B47CA0F|nr:MULTISPECIES: replication-associated recombination protein A [unclassified Parvimonas]MEB3011464.1 replication-associated recombination protein A [Parvimonas sp. D2]MEB3086956.1 replication-associated recombination protein A [Parvimonas sp. D4]